MQIALLHFSLKGIEIRMWIVVDGTDTRKCDLCQRVAVMESEKDNEWWFAIAEIGLNYFHTCDKCSNTNKRGRDVKLCPDAIRIMANMW